VTSKCILITPAHNAAALIEATCQSIAAQTLDSLKWIVVDDSSSDETSSIVDRYRKTYPNRIELISRVRTPGRDFRNKVRAFEAGLARARELGYQYLGNLDADISFAPDYYATLVNYLELNPRVGIVGGLVESRIGGKFVPQSLAEGSVAGAVQLFRSACFDDIGGYRPLPLGGIDAAAEIISRIKGWEVRTLQLIRVLEHRRTGTAVVSPLKARVHEGRRMHSLGYSFPFFCARCVRRSLEKPRLLGSLAALYGFVGAIVQRAPHVLPPEVVKYLRKEQNLKLLNFLRINASSRVA
jgi:glycosyltransferase involved in cell wall biosynthesis